MLIVRLLNSIIRRVALRKNNHSIIFFLTTIGHSV
jgi:hypothetical protein